MSKTLQNKKDQLGWKPPWHYHFRTIRNGVDRPWIPDLPHIYTVNCAAKDCEAPGCPRTISGFPE